MDEPRVDVIGIGAAAWDRYLVVPRHPQPNEKLRAIHQEECAGGTMATALVALQRWGLQSRFVGMLGYDDYSNRILHDLTAEHVDIRYVIRREDADGRRSLILVDNRNGHRSVVSGPHHVPPITPDMLTASMFESARVLHLDTNADECGIEAAAMAKERGMTVTLDAERLQPRTLALIKHCDYTIAPLSFASECTGESKLSLAAYGLHLLTGKPAIVTDGVNGCEYASSDVSFSQSAFMEPAVDTTGAGDVFHAGFIYGLLAAWDVRKCVRFAAWAAACVCREIGGRKAIPARDAIREFSRHDHD